MSIAFSRVARIVLLLSLAANVAFGAWLLVHAPWRPAAGPDFRARRAPVPQLLELREFRHSLPESRQALIDQSLDAHRAQIRPRIGALIDARRAVRAAIVAEPFERAALEQAFARLREAEAVAAREAQALFLDVVEQLSPEERHQLSELVPARSRERWREARRARAAEHRSPSRP